MEIQVPPIEWKTELTPASAKSAIKDSGASGIGDQIMVPIDNIHVVAGLNVRIRDPEYLAHLEEIAVSIIQNGFFKHEPLSGFAGKEGETSMVYCTGGFTRLEAAKIAKTRGAPIEKLPLVLQPSGTNMADLISRLDLDNLQKPLRPFERAIVFKRLINFGWTEEQIAEKHHVSNALVSKLLYMMSLPQALRGLITAGKVNAYDAADLAKKIGPGEALKAYESDLAAKGKLDDDPLSTGTEAQPSAVAEARQRAARGPSVPKKTLFRAIDYTLQLPVGEALKWLKRWRAGEADALAELEAYKPPRKNSAKAGAGKGKGKGKGASGTGTGRGRKGSQASPAAADDPLDISGAETADVL